MEAASSEPCSTGPKPVKACRLAPPSYDNAWTESCIGTLKREMLQGGEFIDQSDARTEIFSYIEGYYNSRRKHSSLGYRTPSQHELTNHQN